ncbi:2386_t:CDS:2 [Diversispora eburnea]|uniref:2386_t:CDS:1 n=1 Tax=Diversispora eburnea TaxID=1213867 RepID=A0A9N8WEN0_9GLOM|nr:2386_t:CDS:2 [Diversispora eburnea]
MSNNSNPPWPSLYWPINTVTKIYLTDPTAGLLAWVVFHKYRWSFLIPISFVIVALLTGLVGGTIVGFLLASLYKSGNFEMSVWVPFLWGLIQAFLLLLGCFTTFTTIL